MTEKQFRAKFVSCLGKYGRERRLGKQVMGDARYELAKKLVTEADLFVHDPSHESVQYNPVVRAVVSIGYDDQPITFRHWAEFDSAWEYFHEKEVSRVTPEHVHRQ